MKNSDKADNLQEKIGIKFADKKLLRQALVHRSYLNEVKEEKESNERLEFLGDAVLEFVVSEHLYDQFKTEDEGHLTALRAKLVNTFSLAQTAQELGIGEMLYLSRGEEQGGGRQNPALLANAVEAIIGAIFQDQGIDAAKEFIERFILKKLPEIVKKSLKDPKSLLQEFVQAAGLAAPYYQVIKEEGPDHARAFTVEVVIDGKPYAQGTGPSKQIATQEAASHALDLWEHKGE